MRALVMSFWEREVCGSMLHGKCAKRLLFLVMCGRLVFGLSRSINNEEFESLERERERESLKPSWL